MSGLSLQVAPLPHLSVPPDLLNLLLLGLLMFPAALLVLTTIFFSNFGLIIILIILSFGFITFILGLRKDLYAPKACLLRSVSGAKKEIKSPHKVSLFLEHNWNMCVSTKLPLKVHFYKMKTAYL